MSRVPPRRNNTISEPESMKQRNCNICGRPSLMSRFQRYCSQDCRDRATEISRSDIEFIPHYNMGN